MTPDDPFVELARFQFFDGSFKLRESLWAYIRKPFESMKEGNCKWIFIKIRRQFEIVHKITVSMKNNWNEDAWATALAITCFMEKYQDQQASWEQIVKKAKLWLTQNYGDQSELFIEAARSFITT